MFPCHARTNCKKAILGVVVVVKLLMQGDYTNGFTYIPFVGH